jgi:hypothetical protein
MTITWSVVRLVSGQCATMLWVKRAECIERFSTEKRLFYYYGRPIGDCVESRTAIVDDNLGRR